MDRAKGLTCRECGRAYPSSPVHVCEHCSGPLEVEYGYGALRGRVSRAAIEWGPPRVWRHVPPLPLDLEDARHGPAAIANPADGYYA